MIKKADKKTIQFYETGLYPFQDEVLALMESNKFYLSGGTCLSRMYYRHRYSDDLDFFFDGNRYDKTAFDAEARQFINRLSGLWKTELFVDAEYFKRFSIWKEDLQLKLELILELTPRIGKPNVKDSFYYDTRQNIAANKITALFGRKTLKDYVDLYYLLNEFSLQEVLRWAVKKMKLPDYEGSTLALVGGALEGTVLMQADLNQEQFDHFVITLHKQLLNHARSL